MFNRSFKLSTHSRQYVSVPVHEVSVDEDKQQIFFRVVQDDKPYKGTIYKAEIVFIMGIGLIKTNDDSQCKRITLRFAGNRYICVTFIDSEETYRSIVKITYTLRKR
jgi:hypothetical protein